MENAVFLTESAENPYSSLPKYGAEESTMVFGEETQQDRISHLSVHTEESLGLPSTTVDSTQPLHTKDASSKEDNPSSQQQQRRQHSRDSSIGRASITRTLNVPDTFADEIRPPSLFSPDIPPPAPSNMRGPIKRREVMASSTPSVFTASRLEGRRAMAPVVQASTVSLQPQPLVAIQPVQYGLQTNGQQPIYIAQSSSPLSGYKVPGSVANSMAPGSNPQGPGMMPKKALKVKSEANERCWKNCLFASLFLVIILVLGSVVAAIVLTQSV